MTFISLLLHAEGKPLHLILLSCLAGSGSTSKPRFTDTHHYYGQFALSKPLHLLLSQLKVNSLNTDTSLIRTLTMAPLIPQCPLVRAAAVSAVTFHLTSHHSSMPRGCEGGGRTGMFDEQRNACLMRSFRRERTTGSLCSPIK